MASRFDTLTRPGPGVTYATPTRHRDLGFALAFIGLALAVVTLIANIAAANQLVSDPTTAARTLAWSFGLTTTAFGTIKFAIGVILVGILIRLWLRVDSVKTSLQTLKADGSGARQYALGETDTDFGPAEVSTAVPAPLPVHRMARTMWFPMLAMGYMAVLAGFVLSLVWANNVGSDPATAADLSAWTQGLQFLGEAMLLGGISFLLGSILAALREGGGEVQKALGLPVLTLKMPATAKAFIALMAVGMMLGVLQFVLYLYVAGSVDPGPSLQAWFAWLGPLREVSLGLLLAGITLALVTIGNVLGFQFQRIREIVAVGR